MLISEVGCLLGIHIVEVVGTPRYDVVVYGKALLLWPTADEHVDVSGEVDVAAAVLCIKLAPVSYQSSVANLAGDYLLQSLGRRLRYFACLRCDFGFGVSREDVG